MTTPPRPDQEIAPPPAVLAPGGASGIFRGRVVIVNGQTPPAGGIFLYDSSGSLVGYWVSIAGTDPLDGSSINPGFQVQNGTNDLQSVNIVPGIITLAKTGGALVSPEIVITDSTQTAPLGSLTISSASGILFDSWHNLSRVNGWGGSLRYQLIPVGSGTMVAVSAALDSSSATAFQVGTMPAAYTPASTEYIAAGANGNVATGVSPFLQVTSAGVVNMSGLHAFSSAGTFVVGGMYPLD